MSESGHVYAVVWFEASGKILIDSVSASASQKPFQQTAIFLRDQQVTLGQAAAALVATYDRATSRLIKVERFYNELGKKKATLKKAVDARLDQFTGLVKSTRKKKLSPSTRALSGRQPAPRKATIRQVLSDIEKRPAVKPCNPMFMQGMQLYMTQGVQSSVSQRVVMAAVKRFGSCDWGDVETRDTRANNAATRSLRGQVHGVYHYPGSPEFNITADFPDRAVTGYLPIER